MLVQEQRFLRAAVEDERIAPLQPNDGAPFACLLRQQETDRVLVERLRRGRPDVDALGVAARQAQQTHVHAMVVQDDVGRFEVLAAAHAD